MKQAEDFEPKVEISRNKQSVGRSRCDFFVARKQL